MAQQDTYPVDSHPLDAGWFILVRIVGMIIIIFAFCLHQFNPLNKSQSSTPNTLKQKFFDNIIIFLCIANGLFTISLITRSICIGCRPSRFCASYGYLTAKILGFLFFVHRAKLVQGIKPILPNIWFETILPSVFLIMGLIYMVGLTMSLLQESEVCVEYENDFLSSSWSPSYCHGNVKEGVSVVFIAGLAIDLSTTIFLLFLFIKPLMDNLKMKNLAQSEHDKQMESRLRSKHLSLLKWSISMTFTNLVSSNLALIGSSILSHREQISRYYLGLDPAINTITCILMITGNRKLLYSIFCQIFERPQTVNMTEGVASNEETSNNQAPSTDSTEPNHFVDQETEQKDSNDGITIVLSQDDERSTVLSEEKEKELFAMFKLSQVQCLRECLNLGLPDQFIDALLKKFAEQNQENS